VYHPLGEDQAAAAAETEPMTSTIIVLETIILGGVATSVGLLVHLVRRLA
jgi:hypothetical protein